MKENKRSFNQQSEIFPIYISYKCTPKSKYLFFFSPKSDNVQPHFLTNVKKLKTFFEYDSYNRVFSGEMIV